MWADAWGVRSTSRCDGCKLFRADQAGRTVGLGWACVSPPSGRALMLADLRQVSINNEDRAMPSLSEQATPERRTPNGDGDLH